MEKRLSTQVGTQKGKQIFALCSVDQKGSDLQSPNRMFSGMCALNTDFMPGTPLRLHPGQLLCGESQSLLSELRPQGGHASCCQFHLFAKALGLHMGGGF